MYRSTMYAGLGLFLGLAPGLHAQGATLPAPSPDGDRLAFVSTRDGDPEVYVLDVEDGAVRRVTRHEGSDDHPSWSPDGRWIAVAAGTFPDLDLWLYPSDGEGEPTRLTNGPGADYWPSWSPDGRRMAFVRLVLDPEAGGPDPERSGIAVMDVERRDRRLILPDLDGINEAPAFSPDGEWIAYHSRRGEDFDLYRARGDGSQATPLREGGAVDEVPVWADASRLYFQTRIDGSWQIWSMAADGSDARAVVVR